MLHRWGATHGLCPERARMPLWTDTPANVSATALGSVESATEEPGTLPNVGEATVKTGRAGWGKGGVHARGEARWRGGPPCIQSGGRRPQRTVPR